tara:strand:- start:15 stop:749 length:735 start_codon:yes stop_codon:yes gene_type:complete
MRVTKEMLKTKAKYFNSGARHAVVSTHMDLLGITDVSTPRQEKNGTVVWRLPIKYGPDRFIEVASFATGYVRNQNGGYTNYQLNKRCESEPQYYELPNGTYNKYTTRSCVLIPSEIDRLEYLIAYCLKNYYIKNANQVANGEYVNKWEHEYQLERNQNKMEEICHLDANASDRIKDLEARLELRAEAVRELEDRVYELTSQVDLGQENTIDLKAQLHVSQEKLSATKVRQDVSVIVNGHRYKVL